MPLYEYKCDNCETQLEKLQKMSEPSLVKCPECTHDTLRKLISATTFKLKGNGWYETDFKTKPKKTETKDTGKKDDK